MNKFKYFNVNMTPLEAEKRLFSLSDSLGIKEFEKVKEEYKSIISIILPKYLKNNSDCMTAF